MRHALSILGERDLRRCAFVAAGVGQEKTSDLVPSALVRSRFGEPPAPPVAQGESDLFPLDLSSFIDALLEMPVERIPHDHATKAWLLRQPSSLRPVFQLRLAQESGE